MTELPVPIGTVVAGRYRVERILGSGNMGVVAAAFHLEFEQAVAIKFVSLEALGQAELTERFRREVRAAAKIKSEHVARVLDVGALDNGLPYMVMELLAGRTLEEELEARCFLPVPEAVDYVLQAIEALAEAHAAGIVHRDLKPANLFITRRADRSRLVKVLDFGVSKSLTESESSLRLTRTGTIVGSPLYMPPEQLRASRSPDVRSDIWALGAVLFELVSGRTPYTATSIPDLYAKLLRDAPNPISRYGAPVPAEFEAVVARCMRCDPAQRFSDVSELAQALLPFAPARARVHAERARGVLFPESRTELAARSSSEPGETAVSDGPGANTVSAWGAQVWLERRRAVLLGLITTVLFALASFALLAIRLDPARTKPEPARQIAAASSLDAFELLPPGPGSVVHSSSSVPIAPPVLAKAAREPEMKLDPGESAAPTSLAPLAAQKAPLLGDRPRTVRSVVGPAAGLSDFGGRK